MTPERVPAKPSRSRSRWRPARRIVLGCGLGSLVLACAAAGVVYVAGNRLGNNIARIQNVFKGINPATRPAVPAAYRSSMTILVVGSDSRSTSGSTVMSSNKPVGADAIMLVHIDASRKAVSVISIPRNTWLLVPGHGMLSFYQALEAGGPALMIRTVEHLTGVRIDHYMVVNLAGLRSVVAALGTVAVDIAEPASHKNVIFHKGLNRLTPRAAMVYVSSTARPDKCRCWQRNGLPGGDLTRVQRQQNLIRAIFEQAVSAHLITDPFALYRLLDALSHMVSVDSGFSNGQISALAMRIARLHAGAFTFVTVPVRGIGWRRNLGVVFLGTARCAGLWNAVRHDAVAAWAARHPALVTPQAPY